MDLDEQIAFIAEVAGAAGSQQRMLQSVLASLRELKRLRNGEGSDHYVQFGAAEPIPMKNEQYIAFQRYLHSLEGATDGK